MKRKIVQQAGGAYTVTLPIEWVRDNGLSKGSEVDVLINENSVVVSDIGRNSERKARIDVSNLGSKDMYRHICALYAAGVDEIEISSRGEISSKIIHLLNSLVGYVLISQSEEKYIIRDVGGSPSVDLDEIFKRAFQAVILFYDSAYRDIFGCGCETEKNLRMRDLEVNKLCLYLQRAINKKSYGDTIRGRALFSYSIDLEKIGDEILRLWRSNIGNGPKESLKLKELLNSSKKCLEASFDLYYRFNSKDLGGLYDLVGKVRKLASQEGNGELVQRALRIAEAAADLSHMTLMIKLE